MQDDNDSGYCFQLIERGVAFPPILLKAELQPDTAASNGDPSSSQSIRYSAVRFQAIRFLNGKQELVQLDLGGEDDSSDAFVKAVSGRKGLNKRLTKSDCCQASYDRVKKADYVADYDKEESTLKIALQDIPALDVTFDFGTHVKRSPATPAFVLAFEAACSFGKLMHNAKEASNQASEELKLKSRELIQAERKASNLSEDLSREKQKFQRLLSSGGSSMEDALAPRTSKGGRRAASSLMEGSILALDPDSPRKRRKAADAVLVKAGRTAAKETKKGFIDSSSEDDDDETGGPPASKKSKKGGKPSSTDTAPSSSTTGKGSTSDRTKQSTTSRNTLKRQSKLVEEPTLNARRSVRSAKNAPKSGFVESDDEDEEDDASAGIETAGTGGENQDKKAGKKKARDSDSGTEKTASDS